MKPTWIAFIIGSTQGLIVGHFDPGWLQVVGIGFVSGILLHMFCRD